MVKWWGALAFGLVVAGGLAFYALGRPNPDAVWERANQAIARDDFPTAAKEIALLASLRDSTPEDDVLKAQYLIATKQIDEAITRLDHVPDSSPVAAQARFQAGQLELRRGRVHKAEMKYLESIRLEPRAVRPRRELIYILGMQSRWAELADAMRQLGKLTPLTVDDVTLWCLTRSMKWRPEEMTSDLQAWLNADPEDLHTRKALAENLFRRQRAAEAQALIEGLPIDDPDIRAFLAKLAVDDGDIPKAEALLKEGPTDHAKLAWLRGRVALHDGDGERALRQFEIAIKADPYDRDVISGMARALLILGRVDEAKKYQQLTKSYDTLSGLIESLAMDRVKPSAEFFKTLAQAYESVGRLEEAKAWYGLVIGKDPLDAEAQRALFRIKSAEESRNKT